MRDHAIRDLHVSARGQVTRRGLQEKERLLWDRVVELLSMLAVVSADGYNLPSAQSSGKLECSDVAQPYLLSVRRK